MTVYGTQSFRHFLVCVAISACYQIAQAGPEASALKSCLDGLARIPEAPGPDGLKSLCEKSQQIESCTSADKQPIYHFDFGTVRKGAKRILVFSLIHGDEIESGSIAIRWMERLSSLESRSHWRIVPVLNPDGFHKKTRTNANGVDLNRNFPSQDWHSHALQFWNKKINKDPRRFPGNVPASEPETKCALDQIDAYKPDFIVSVHTPYGVLDFDGPKVDFPAFGAFPWVSLGTFPGSLGRYMWKDRRVPVLTIELKDGKFLERMDQVDQLQDISGTLALRSVAEIEKRINH